jgi:Kef-type K+ transport system membrane component KefB
MFTSLTILVVAGLLGPLLSAGKKPLTPVLVGELIGGVLVGNTGLHLIAPAVQPFPAFMTLGFAMLMLEAGREIDLAKLEIRQGARRGAMAMLVTLVLSVPAGLAINAALGTNNPALFIVLISGSSAAVAFPIIYEREITGPVVGLLVVWIALADAVTAVLMPLTLSGPGRIPGALLGDLLIVAVAVVAYLVARELARTALVSEAIARSKARHWALQLRISLLLLIVLAAIAEKTGASLLVAGFAAGIVLRQFHEPHRLVYQLAGLAAGFFVPAFFVLLGATLDLKGWVSSPSAIVLAIGMALAAVAVHLLAAIAVAKDDRVSAGLVASAQLGLPAAAAALALASHALSPPVAAALVAGGLLTLIPASAGARMLAGAR